MISSEAAYNRQRKVSYGLGTSTPIPSSYTHTVSFCFKVRKDMLQPASVTSWEIKFVDNVCPHDMTDHAAIVYHNCIHTKEETFTPKKRHFPGTLSVWG